MMAKTYEPIATTTLGSSASSYTFSSISQAYTDLVVVANAKFTGAVDNSYYCRFNSDSGSNYSGTIIYGSGSSAASGRVSNQTSLEWGRITSNNFNYSALFIQNYSNTTTYKSTLSRGGTSDGYVVGWANLWRSTAAISTIEIIAFATGGNFAAGSTFTIYGIKAA